MPKRTLTALFFIALAAHFVPAQLEAWTLYLVDVTKL